MSLPLVLRRAARAEFDEAFDWYEQQRAGLGVRFAAGWHWLCQCSPSGRHWQSQCHPRPGSSESRDRSRKL